MRGAGLRAPEAYVGIRRRGPRGPRNKADDAGFAAFNTREGMPAHPLCV